MEVGFFAGLITAFAFGTVWFYLACVVTFFGIMALSENEHELFAIVVLGAFVFLMEKSGAFNVFADPWVLLKWSVLYFVIGTVWSFIKWWSFVVKKSEVFVQGRMYFLNNLQQVFNQQRGRGTVHSDPAEDAKETFERSNITPDEKTKVPPALQGCFLKYLRDNQYITTDQMDRKDVTPSAIDNKSKITTWIIWWPTSALWTLLSDPMVRLANWIFSRLKGTYQLISNRAFAKFE